MSAPARPGQTMDTEGREQHALAWCIPGVPVPARPRWAQHAGCRPLTLRRGQERRGRPGTWGWLRALADSELACLPAPSEALGRLGRALLVTSSDFSVCFALHVDIDCSDIALEPFS